MAVNSYLAALAASDINVACVTNHGNMSDYDALVILAPNHLSIIPGVEISSREGDFLIFSRDFDYLRTLDALQPLPERKERPEGTAVVWAHPFAGTAGGLNMGEQYLASVAPRVDGIEVYNGNWPDEPASLISRLIAERYHLAQLGGSDAHRRKNLFRCWTEVPEIKSPEELVQAILSRETTAVKG